MAIYCLGSINVDRIYRVPHLPAPGETIAARSYDEGLGGKGANQSVAAARAGATVHHIGAVGVDGGWAKQALSEFGVGVEHIAELDGSTGHAIIAVDDGGENAIIIEPGANQRQSVEVIEAALGGAETRDLLLLQNETSHQVEAAQIAQAKGMRVIYSPAPFSVEAVNAVLRYVSILTLNAVEADQLQSALGKVPVPEAIITHGSDGAEWRRGSAETVTHPAFPVTATDTTGAGDCFAGSVAAALNIGASRHSALRYASGAAALQVTRPGAASAMPTRAEVEAFLGR